MIFGKLDIEDGAVNTHNDSYALESISVVSARRPFLGAAAMLSTGVGCFVLAFADLLTIGEISGAVCAMIAIISAGFWLGHLQFLSRDLRGSDLSCAVWGGYRHLNKARRDIARAARAIQSEARP